MKSFRALAFLLATVAAAGFATSAMSEPGVSDTEIRIGQAMPFSGPLSSLSVASAAEDAYFRYVNDEGGVNGRKIKLIAVDDGYNPAVSVEQTRKLVESEDVLLIFQSIGTATNVAVQKYLNARKVPQLFVGSASSRFNNPTQFPWTLAWSPTQDAEASIYGRWVLANHPDAKIGILYQNDDFGKEYLRGFKEGLGEKAPSMIVKEVSYDVSEPTIDSQILALQSSGADLVFYMSTPKASAQALRKSNELGWKPTQIVAYSSSSIAGVLRAIGLERVQGLISATYLKDPNSPLWSDDAAVKQWRAWLAKYLPAANPNDFLNVYGYSVAQAMVDVLKRSGSDLSRPNVMTQATSIDLTLPMLLPGVRVRTNPADMRPIKQMQIQKIEGERWIPVGEVIDAK